MAQVKAKPSSWRDTFRTMLKNGGALVTDEKGNVLFTHRADEHFIPASTIKVATAACALEVLGGQFRYKTDFYADNNGRLYVKGYGDPLITSEEWPRIISSLKPHLPKTIREIVLDASYFDRNLAIDGVGSSNNPYDALNSALLTNFNTATVRKLKNGKVEAGEKQTPLTPLIIERAKKLPVGTHRINLASSRTTGLQYFGEILAAFLKKNEVEVNAVIREGSVPTQASLIYRHVSSKSLHEVLEGLLKYSTNLTTNQVFLTMGSTLYGPPATVAKGVDTLTDCLKQKVGLQNFQVAEGSGLSRNNKFTPREMIKLLDFFAPYKSLMPLKDSHFRAKTGTIRGVNTYIGYIDLPQGRQARFAILVNDVVPFDYKFTLAKFLHQSLSAQLTK